MYIIAPFIDRVNMVLDSDTDIYSNISLPYSNTTELGFVEISSTTPVLGSDEINPNDYLFNSNVITPESIDINTDILNNNINIYSNTKTLNDTVLNHIIVSLSIYSNATVCKFNTRELVVFFWSIPEHLIPQHSMYGASDYDIKVIKCVVVNDEIIVIYIESMYIFHRGASHCWYQQLQVGFTRHI